MTQFEKKQLSIFARKLRAGLKEKSVFVDNRVNDTEEDSIATLQLQPGWITALFVMSELLSIRVEINGDGSSTPASVWNLLKEAESFLKIAGR